MLSQYWRLDGRQAPASWRHGEAAMLLFIGRVARLRFFKDFLKFARSA
jgi:hypothetical protein